MKDMMRLIDGDFETLIRFDPDAKKYLVVINSWMHDPDEVISTHVTYRDAVFSISEMLKDDINSGRYDQGIIE